MNVSKACEILGVDINYTPELLKKRYRKLAMEYHPDKGGTAEQFAEIHQAYNYLCKNVTCQEEDIISNIFKTFTKSFTQKRQRKSITITAKEYFEGTKSTVTLSQQCYCRTICMDCMGCGFSINENISMCESCTGDGYTQNCLKCDNGVINKKITIIVPPKITNIQHPEVILDIKIKKPYFLKNNQVYCYFDITLKESLTGFSKKFKDPFGTFHDIIVNDIIKPNDGYRLNDIILVFIVIYPRKLPVEQLKQIDF